MVFKKECILTKLERKTAHKPDKNGEFKQYEVLTVLDTDEGKTTTCYCDFKQPIDFTQFKKMTTVEVEFELYIGQSTRLKAVGLKNV